MIGMPEARIILAEAALAVATAPKSNAGYNAINSALADVDAGLIGQVAIAFEECADRPDEKLGQS